MAQIYLAPGRDPVISAIAVELAQWSAQMLTEPVPENLAALLQQLDAKSSAVPAANEKVSDLRGKTLKETEMINFNTDWEIIWHDLR